MCTSTKHLGGGAQHYRNNESGKFICGWRKNSAQRQEMASATALRATRSEQLVQGTRLYRTLDDFDVLEAARRDPEALVGGHEPITLDDDPS